MEATPQQPAGRGNPARRSAACHAFAGPVLAVFALLGGCASAPPDIELKRSAYNCIDDSVECIGRRQALLRQLTADSSRAWMREPPTPEAYASGVRLFAMKTKKRELTCDELERGRREADGAHASLKSAGTLIPPAQVARGSMFASEVGRELTNEHGRRCKKV